LAGRGRGSISLDRVPKLTSWHGLCQMRRRPAANLNCLAFDSMLDSAQPRRRGTGWPTEDLTFIGPTALSRVINSKNNLLLLAAQAAMTSCSTQQPSRVITSP